MVPSPSLSIRAKSTHASMRRMLALTDAQLADLAIAATAVDHRRRKRWLRDLADRIDPPRARSPAARRQARVRARRRNGVHVYRLELSDVAVEGLILRSILHGQLTESQALEHRHIEHVLGQLLEEEGFRWAR